MLCLAVVLSAITVFVGMSRSYHEKQMYNEIIADELKEHRRYQFYNGSHVYQQDVVSVILGYKGDRDITVLLEDGTELSWTSEHASTDYKVANVSTVLPRETLYDSDIVKDANGIITGFIFKQCTPGSGCGRS